MSTVKTNQVTHLSNTGTANLQLDQNGNTTVADLTANTVSAQTLTLTQNLTVQGNTTIGSDSNDSVTFNASVTGSNFVGGIVGEIRMWSSPTAPTGWLICDGRTIGKVGSGATLENAEYGSLFDIIKGTSGAGLYGNVGTESFASGNTVKLPDFKGRMPIGTGQQANTKYNSSGNYTSNGTNFSLGGSGGHENHKIVEDELAQHLHDITVVSATANLNNPAHQHAIDDSQMVHAHGGLDHHHNFPGDDGLGQMAGSDWNKTTRVSTGYNYDAVSTNSIPSGSPGGTVWETSDTSVATQSVSPGNMTYWSAWNDTTQDPVVEPATTNVTDSGHTHTASSANVGASETNPMSILNPYLAIHFIIKF